jgi:hypothetical protein
MEIAATLRAATKCGASFGVNDNGLVVHGASKLPALARICIEAHESTFRTIASLQGWFQWLQVEHSAYLAGDRETFDETYNEAIEQFELGQRLLRVVQGYQECIWGSQCVTYGPLVCSACTMRPKPRRWQSL